MNDDQLNELRQALANGNKELAREKLGVALHNPTPEIYLMASKVALDETQQQHFLNKALELDPFYEAAHIELRQLQSRTLVPTIVERPSLSHSHPVNLAPVQPYIISTPSVAKKRLSWLWIVGPIVLVAIVLVGAGIVAVSGSAGISSAANPTFTPLPALPTAVPTPLTVVLAKTVSYDECTLPSVTSATFRKGQVIQACVTPKEVGQYQNVTLIARLLVDGKPQSYATMYTYWNYYYFPASYTNNADSDGLARVRVNTTMITVNYPVIVDVTFNYNGQKISLDTSKIGPTTFLPTH